MDKRTKIFIWTLVVVCISGINLSSMCKHPVPLNLDTRTLTNTSEASVIEATTSSRENLIDEAGLIEAFAGKAVELSWRTLTNVEFKDVYIEELDAYYWKPTFGDTVRSFEGKDVFITGYVIPVDYDADFYVLSRYPFANCYFCGGAGPESVIDLRFKTKSRKYVTDERLTFTGKLQLNADDVYQMNYILDGAVEYK
jgi:hypothetical protein